MGKKQTITEQVVWLLLQVATMQVQIEKIAKILKIEHILKRSCQAEAVARSNDACRTPPSTKRSGEVPRSRSSRPSPATPPTPPFPRSTPLSPLSPLQNFTLEEILECLSPSFNLELELKVLEERARTKRD